MKKKTTKRSICLQIVSLKKEKRSKTLYRQKTQRFKKRINDSQEVNARGIEAEQNAQ